MRRFRPLAESLAQTLKVKSAILDGEIVVKDATGRPMFVDMLRRREDASYVAFDLLWLNGRDLRKLSLIERKRVLRRLLPQRSKLIEETLFVPDRGRMLLTVVQQYDLEGIVAKRKADSYAPRAEWIKIKNPSYSQAEGRGELFHPTKPP